jgi:hypothetical protein
LSAILLDVFEDWMERLVSVTAHESHYYSWSKIWLIEFFSISFRNRDAILPWDKRDLETRPVELCPHAWSMAYNISRSVVRHSFNHVFQGN